MAANANGYKICQDDSLVLFETEPGKKCGDVNTNWAEIKTALYCST